MVHGRMMVALDHTYGDIGRASYEPFPQMPTGPPPKLARCLDTRRTAIDPECLDTVSQPIHM